MSKFKILSVVVFVALLWMTLGVACSTTGQRFGLAADCPSWIQVISRPTGNHYEVTSCRWSETGTNVYLTVLDQYGAPLSGITVYQQWPDGLISKETKAGGTDFAMGGSGCYPDAGKPGALEYFVESMEMSDVIKGFCLPANRHFDFFVTLKYKLAGTVVPPPSLTPSGGPTTVPGSYLSKQDARRVLIDIGEFLIREAQTIQ